MFREQEVSRAWVSKGSKALSNYFHLLTFEIYLGYETSVPVGRALCRAFWTRTNLDNLKLRLGSGGLDLL